jgi:sugar phosphate isomerase/epimerase
MKISNVAAQLFTIRDHLKTPADIATSLKKVRAIGYESVQVSGMGPIAEDELARILKGEGLVCCSTHENGTVILNEPQKIVDRLRKLGCTLTAYPYPGGVEFNSTEAVSKLASGLNAAGKVLAQAGMILAYHNHNIEFRKVGGKTILGTLYAETDARYLQAELDTYWVQAGGGDPVAWCRRMKRRLPMLHMKDFGVNDQNQGTFAEIGSGNLDWPAIIAASEKSGCTWFIVEQDGAWRNGDPFESLKISFEYIRGHLCA